MDNFNSRKEIVDGKEVIIDFWQEQFLLKDTIIQETKEVVLHDFIIKDFVQPLLSPNSHGTTFVIFNPDQQLLALAKNADKRRI